MRDVLAVCDGRHHFFQAHPSAQHWPAWRRPGAASAASSRLLATSTAWPRKPPSLATKSVGLNPFGRYGILLSLAAVLGLPLVQSGALIPCLRHSSATETPVSLTFKIPIIRCSTNLLRFIVRSLLRSGFYEVLEEIPTNSEHHLSLVASIFRSP